MQAGGVLKHCMLLFVQQAANHALFLIVYLFNKKPHVFVLTMYETWLQILVCYGSDNLRVLESGS